MDKRLRVLFAFHSSVKPYENQLNDEIDLLCKEWTKLGINYEITKKDFDYNLEYQDYANGSFKALSFKCQQEIAAQIEDPGEFHIIYIIYKPEVQGTAGVFTTYPWYKANGSIIINIPLTEQDATRTDHYLWRVLFHEGIHAFFGLLNLNTGKKILDIQDQSYAELRKIKPNPTEDDYTQLSESIFNTWIKPHLDALYSEPIEFQQASILKGIITILNGILALLLAQKKKQSVIDRLAEYIAEFEGFYKDGTVAQRNHNPGNLVSSPYQIGTKDGFASFLTDNDGWKALKYQLQLIFDGKSKYYRPDMTIQEFINVYASTSPENERISYAQYIANHFGVDVNTKLNQLT